MELKITDNVAALMPLKGAITGADLYEEVKKVLWISQYRR
jgi:hypothetical protein